jgi:hypothetical protein
MLGRILSTEDTDVDIDPDLRPIGASGTRLMRRAGTHREPRMYDWRRRAGRRSTVTGIGPMSRARRGLAVVAVAVAATLVVGGTHFLLAAARADQKPPAAALPSVGSLAATSSSGVVQVTDSPTPSSSATSAGPATSSPGATTTQAPVAGQTTTSGQTSAPTTTNSTTPAKTRTTPAKTTAPTKKPTKQPTKKPSAAPSTTTPPVVPVTGTGAVVGIAGKCLDVANAQAVNGTTVQIYTCNGTNAQLWTAQGGTLRAYGKCLAGTGGAGSRLVLRDCDGSGNQSWQLLSRTIVNPTSNLCVDVDGGSSADRTATIAATCNGSTAQTWTLS